ncbi:protein translocase subunit SecDF [Chelativorans sp. Marseille-P2723]|uniref:protein translocase subunit SecDF n=1 Tax=Chelativorans sp. Marseille-P2723 TaxID=2709133 RepID=UPI0015708034|nr:protein translocase subunit SecDF [Chelativorans sp. Marseille-P2723]
MLYFSRWQSILIWLVVALGVVYAAPNLFPQSFLSSLPGWVPSKQMTLGLDLQGGSHILLQVDRKSLVAERLSSIRDDVRTLLREQRIGYTGLSSAGQSVQVRIRDADQVDAARRAISELTQPITGTLFGSGSVRELQLAEPERGLLRLTLTDEGINYRLSTAVTQSIEVVGRRVNELGTTEPIIQRQGNDRVLVQVPGLQDPQRLKDILGQTARLTFQMVDQSMPVEEAINGRPPVGTSVMYSTDNPPVPYIIEDRVIVSGENLVDAQAGFDQLTNEPVVTFRFDTRGATRFGQATQQNVGRLFAIILDNQVISAPQIREPILGGTGQISGNFTVQSANDLAVLLRAGALPADLSIIEERTVGPSLGQDSIEAGKIAAVVASILVIGTMLVIYGWLGVIANLALMANVAIIVAILTVLGATLTLPGIAGIVLTIGMAVDSNVIIFERVREEVARGRSLVQSFDQGFQKALATIVDANLTSMIVAAILFYVGTGPVRGFAVTLAIGLLTTVFTAYTLSRWMIAVWWLRRFKPKQLPAGLVHKMPLEPKIGFMKARRLFFALSVALTAGAAGLFFVKDFNYGIDFQGGSLIEVQARSGEADPGNVRSRLSELDLGEIQVQAFGDGDALMIRLQAQDGGDTAEQEAMLKVRGALEDDYEFRRIEVVGPTVSGELAVSGMIGILLSMIGMLIYIWLRFEWQFGVGAIVSTAHDVVMIVGIYLLLGLEMNLTAIAAILTVVGYSINDTIVIYDRIRETLRKYKKMPIEEVINLSLNQTLSRTILTGVTTLFALIALYLFGGEVIASFVLPIMIGIFIGIYSSLFIAGPMLIMFNLRPDTFGVEEEKSGAVGQAKAGT